MQHHYPTSLSIQFKSYLIYLIMVPCAMLSNILALLLGPFFDKKHLFPFVIGSFSYFTVTATRWICGVDFEVIGQHHLPEDKSKGHVVMSNHQSSWETFFYSLFFHRIPLF